MRLLAVLFGILVPVAAAAADKKVDELARKCAQGKPKDCAKLAEVARTHPQWTVRRDAVAAITDRAILADIARSETDAFVRQAVLQSPHLTDAATLAHLARNDADVQVRLLAVKSPHLTDQAVFEAAASDAEWRVRSAALDRITGEAALARVLMLDPKTSGIDAPLRAATLRRITDPALLGEIYLRAAPASPTDVLDRIKDAEVLLGLVDRVERGRHYALDYRLSLQVEGADDAMSARMAKVCVERTLGSLCGRLVMRFRRDPAKASLLADMAIGITHESMARSGVEVADAATGPLALAIAERAGRPEVRARALTRVANPTAALGNAVLSSVLARETWPALHEVWERAFTVTAENRATLTALAGAKRGFVSHAARAILAGLPARRWPKLSLDTGVSIVDAASGTTTTPLRLAPGVYAFEARFEGSMYNAMTRRFETVQSARPYPIQGTLAADRCYSISAGGTHGTVTAVATWSPTLNGVACR